MWNSLKSAEANDESKSARVNNSPDDKKSTHYQAYLGTVLIFRISQHS
ncbi:MAG: hypothetical protein H6911_03785 [Rickettsiaceae bacterium]|nr:hypothetical protein [Rickettsiaceae bacterium]